MIMRDIYPGRSGILQINGKNYGFNITSTGHEFGTPNVMLSGVLVDAFREFNRLYEERKSCTIERVIFNNPATIVIWSDKTKTVVKCQPGDIYDPEKGLALCISKKFLGNKGNFNEVFKKWIPEVVEVIDDKDDEIRVGSKVEVVNSGRLYSAYEKWVERNVKTDADRYKWGRGSTQLFRNLIGRVLYLAEHETIEYNGMLAYVDFGKTCEIIGVSGLRKIK